jgi:hypothetical protein
MTDCECSQSGWCERHKCKKSANMVGLCQNNPSYWMAWEEGRGPGQKKPVTPNVVQIERPKRLAKPKENAWVVIHTRLGQAIGKDWNEKEQKRWYKRTWLPTIPATGCPCQNHWKQLTDAMPIDWSSAEAAFYDLWKLHNHVSLHKSHKPTLSLEQAKVLYIPDNMPEKRRCVVTVATGAKWHEILSASRESISHYAKKCGADYYELRDSTEDWWGLEKFRTKLLADKYEQTLFIDADVWIKDSCPDLFELVPAGHVGMHDDYDHLIQKMWLTSNRQAVALSQGVEIENGPTCLNSGVVVCDRSTSSVWTRPQNKLPVNLHCSEQIWVEHQASAHPITRLPVEFNTQWWMRDFADRMEAAHIIHFANSTQKFLDITNASKTYPIPKLKE